MKPLSPASVSAPGFFSSGFQQVLTKLPFSSQYIQDVHSVVLLDPVKDAAWTDDHFAIRGPSKLRRSPARKWVSLKSVHSVENVLDKSLCGKWFIEFNIFSDFL